MASFIDEIKKLAILDESTGLMKLPEEKMPDVNEIICKAKQMAQRPKKPPNAFIIFKSKLKLDSNEVSGRGTQAKLAKERWDNMSISEREVYVREYDELKKKHTKELENYNKYFNISSGDKVSVNRVKKSKNDGEPPKKRGRPRKNPIEKNDFSVTSGTELFKYKGVEYLWDKSNDEVSNMDGEHIGYKTANGFTEI